MKVEIKENGCEFEQIQACYLPEKGVLIINTDAATIEFTEREAYHFFMEMKHWNDAIHEYLRINPRDPNK